MVSYMKSNNTPFDIAMNCKLYEQIDESFFEFNEESRKIEDIEFTETSMATYKKLLEPPIYQMLEIISQIKNLVQEDFSGSNASKVNTIAAKLKPIINKTFKFRELSLDKLEFVNVNELNTAYTYFSKADFKIVMNRGRVVGAESVRPPEYAIKISWKLVRLCNPDEILAIILHELGHNYHMYRVQFRGEKLIRWNDMFKRLGYKHTILGKIFQFFLFWKGEKGYEGNILFTVLFYILAMFTGAPLMIPANYLKGEVPADDFAVMHKLGGPLSTGLKKLVYQAYEVSDRKLDKFNTFFDKLRIMKGILGFNTDDVLNERFTFMLTTLENNLKNTKRIAPEEEKLLREQIENIKKTITDRSFRGKVKEIKERLFSDSEEILEKVRYITNMGTITEDNFPFEQYTYLLEMKNDCAALLEDMNELTLSEIYQIKRIDGEIESGLRKCAVAGMEDFDLF